MVDSTFPHLIKSSSVKLLSRIKDTRTYFMLCRVTRDDHGHDVQSFGAATKAVDVGDVWTLIIHRLH